MVLVEINYFPEVVPDDGGVRVLLFDGDTPIWEDDSANGIVVAVLDSTADKTVLEITTPDLQEHISSNTEITFQVFTGAFDYVEDRPTFVFQFVSGDPLLVSVSPTSVGSSGGTFALVTLANVWPMADGSEMVVQVSAHRLDDLGSTLPPIEPCSGGACFELVNVEHDPATKIMKVLTRSPEINLEDCSESAACPPKVVYFDVQVSELLVPVSVALFDDGVMAFGDVAPLSIPTTGHQKLQIQIVKWNIALAQGPEDLWVTVAGEAADVIGFEAVGSDTALVTAISPVFPAAVVAADLAFGTSVDTDEPLLEGAGVLAVHAVCGFDGFCGGRGLVVNEFSIMDVPPLDESCAVEYCMEEPPDPLLVSFNLEYATTVGGESATIVVANWPYSQSTADFEGALLGTGGARTPLADVVLVQWTALETTIRYATPGVATENAGVHTVYLSHTASGKSLSFELQVVNYPEGSPQVVTHFPETAFSNTDNIVYVELENCPPVRNSAGVTVTVGGEEVSLLSLDSSFELTSFTFEVGMHSGCQTGRCDTAVDISVIDRNGASRAAAIVFTHIAPTPLVLSVFPLSGLVDDEQMRVTISVNNLFQGTTQVLVDNVLEVRVEWDGEPVAIIDGTFRTEKTAATFAVLVPVSYTAETVDVLVSNRDELSSVLDGSGQARSFQYEYTTRGPLVVHVEPASVELSREFSDGAMTIYGKYIDVTAGVDVIICGVAQTLAAESYEQLDEVNGAFHFFAPACDTPGSQPGTLNGASFNLDYVTPSIQAEQTHVAPGLPLELVVWSEYALDDAVDWAAIQFTCAGVPFLVCQSYPLADGRPALGSPNSCTASPTLSPTPVPIGSPILSPSTNPTTQPSLDPENVDQEAPLTRHLEDGPGFWWVMESVVPQLDVGEGKEVCTLTLPTGTRKGRMLMAGEATEIVLDFFVNPSLEYVSPSTLYASKSGGTDDISIGLLDFPTIAGGGIQTLEIKIDGAVVPLSSFVQNQRQTILTAVLPRVREPVVLYGSIRSVLYEYIPVIEFSLTYKNRQPELTSLFPRQAASNMPLDDAVTVEMVLLFTAPVDTNDLSAFSISAGYGSANAWSVDAIVYSDDSGTLLQARPPLVGTPSTVRAELTVTATGIVVPFFFQYFDSSIEVLSPLRECDDADVKWSHVPHCATWSDLGASIAVKVRGFPERDLTGDLIATINKAFPVAIEVLDCGEDDPAGLLCASISRAGGSLEDLTFGDDGTSRREVVISLRSVPSVSTQFSVIFLNRVAAVSAQFVSNYGFIEVDFNQPVNGRLLGESGATSCALFIEEGDLVRIGHDVTRSDELRLCTWLSSRRMQVRFTPSEGQEDVMTPDDAIHLKAGGLLDDGAHASTANAAQSLEVVERELALRPEASIIGGTTIGFCDDMILDGSTSSGNELPS